MQRHSEARGRGCRRVSLRAVVLRHAAEVRFQTICAPLSTLLAAVKHVASRGFGRATHTVGHHMALHSADAGEIDPHAQLEERESSLSTKALTVRDRRDDQKPPS